jgi:FkbM family methyltransferase
VATGGFVDFESLAAAVRSDLADQGTLDLGGARRTWIYGPGNFGRAVAKALIAQGVPVGGFVATRPADASCMGLPVVTPDVAARDAGAQVAVGVFNRESPYAEIAAVCANAGLGPVVWPMNYYHQIAGTLGWRYWLGDPSAFAADLERIQGAHGLLSDETSRATFARILRFRLGHDLSYSTYLDDEEQYFLPLALKALPQDHVTFVDCGAFDGDSFLALSRHRSTGRGFLFEPDRTNYAALVERVRASSLVATCIPCAVSDRLQDLYFSGSGEAVAAGEEGRPIVAVKLDEMLGAETIDFLKLDIEGGEAAAIEGARDLIARSRPIIAMSLYHKQRDLWELPLQVAGIVDGYDFFIRQHMYNSFESVLYAIPRHR